MDALIVSYKPSQISSNFFLNRLKKKYNMKKAGYSGTLDPFARGCLIVGFGSYTKLFPFIEKNPKVYEATLWLGAKSLSLDMENIINISEVKSFEEEKIKDILLSLKGKISYIPPQYSAKKINGRRSYELARAGIVVKPTASVMEIFEIEFLCYNHPYVSFRVSVSEGTYVRSIGEIIAKKLEVDGTLSSLERISEGNMRARVGETYFVNPLKVLKYPIISNFDAQVRENLWLGRKFSLESQKNGIYIANFEDFFSIIEIKEDGNIRYLLNRMNKNVDFIKKA
ncbi:tRNA pseudouridine(55) synthase TruB [Helicobacter cappadocius]|uniref:tRNA pseudouridine synthase B n=1 Tax=Helicobacter cappadocius TaxID=3063998 RepID=A0AA90PRE3_9HELI|nr:MULTISPECIES: tRNA pseudouridine(55) synthase TruB [unclassified Helicobacter]MDO7253633.1 tRNA pseudouridine(55) synthase TruB [Helicobacter sp. faydin-H75]MDP2539561.1 tRNA pseudouridine(55) synthase TruB [Helicobacter sp. faydin-H76]